MAAGAWVFPIVLVGFVGALGGYLVVTPVDPQCLVQGLAPQEGTVHAGDVVQFSMNEYTQAGLLTITTDEALANNRTVPRSPYGVLPLPFNTVQIDPNATYRDGSIFSHFIGHGEEETWRTPVCDELHGAWADTRDVTPLTVHYEYLMNVSDDPAVNEFYYDYTRFATEAGVAGVSLDVGPDRFGCEGSGLWNCTIVSHTPETRTLVLRRWPHEHALSQLPDGTPKEPGRYDPEGLYFTGEVPFHNAAPPTLATFKVQDVTDDRFRLVLDLRTGDTLTLGRDYLDDWKAGAYKAVAVQADKVTVRFAPPEAVVAQPGEPGLTQLHYAHLIEEPVWREYKIGRIVAPDEQDQLGGAGEFLGGA